VYKDNHAAGTVYISTVMTPMASQSVMQRILMILLHPGESAEVLALQEGVCKMTILLLQFYFIMAHL